MSTSDGVISAATYQAIIDEQYQQAPILDKLGRHIDNLTSLPLKIIEAITHIAESIFRSLVCISTAGLSNTLNKRATMACNKALVDVIDIPLLFAGIFYPPIALKSHIKASRYVYGSYLSQYCNNFDNSISFALATDELVERNKKEKASKKDETAEGEDTESSDGKEPVVNTVNTDNSEGSVEDEYTGTDAADGSEKGKEHVGEDDGDGTTVENGDGAEGPGDGTTDGKEPVDKTGNTDKHEGSVEDEYTGTDAADGSEKGKEHVGEDDGDGASFD